MTAKTTTTTAPPAGEAAAGEGPDPKRLETLAGKIERASAGLADLLKEAAEATGLEILARMERDVRHDRGNWVAKRLRGLATPRPTTAPEGIRRRRDALAQARKGGDEAEVARLEGELARLGGEGGEG